MENKHEKHQKSSHSSKYLKFYVAETTCNSMDHSDTTIQTTKTTQPSNLQKTPILQNKLKNTNVVNRRLRKIVICSNSARLQCYSAATWQHFVQNRVLQNNSGLFIFQHAIAAIWQHWRIQDIGFMHQHEKGNKGSSTFTLIHNQVWDLIRLTTLKNTRYWIHAPTWER